MKQGFQGEGSGEGVLLSLVQEWEEKLDVEVESVLFRRMEGKWGRCDHRRRILWFHPDLLQQERKLVESVVAEQMVHLLESTKNQCFVKLMEYHHPEWEDSSE